MEVQYHLQEFCNSGITLSFSSSLVGGTEYVRGSLDWYSVDVRKAAEEWCISCVWLMVLSGAESGIKSGTTSGKQSTALRLSSDSIQWKGQVQLVSEDWRSIEND